MRSTGQCSRSTFVFLSTKDLNFLLLGDDTVIYLSDKNIQNLRHKLNIELLKAKEWLTANRLTLNQKQPSEVFCKFTGKHLRQRLFFNEVAGLRLAILLKKSIWRKCFPVNFAKFLRTPFLQNTSGRLCYGKFGKLGNMHIFRLFPY